MTTKTLQLEISLTHSICRPRLRRRPRPTSRAGWWFAQMRRVVDEVETRGADATIATKQPHLPVVGD